MRTVGRVPLKHIAGINLRKLAEDTDPAMEFRYLDIGSVGRGFVSEPPETLRFADAPSRARRLVSPGDTIVSTVRTYLRAVLPIGDEADELVVSTGFAVVSPRKVDARFLSWYLQSDPFVDEVVARSVGVSYPAINPSEIGQMEVPLPSIAEQRAIAAYLDAETTRIDALIAKKRQMVSCLGDRVHAYSVRHVLGDLGAEGPRTQSTSGLYPSVPAGWNETSLRHLGCEVQTGPFGSQLHAEDYVDSGWPVVNPMNIVDGQIVEAPGMTVTDAKREELARHILRPGDIVFGRRGEMGRAGLVTDTEAGWICGTGSLRLRLVGSYFEPEYLKLLLASPPARSYFELASVGSTMDNLNSEIVLAFPALVPPREVQGDIVRKVRLHADSVAAGQSKLHDQIDLLVEHRQALITAAVTGELSVPGVAA